MTKTKEQVDLEMGWTLLMNQARIISMLPIEEWLAALEHAEAVAPFVDPTMYREYLYSPKPEIIKKLMRASLELKRVVHEVQPKLQKMMEEEHGASSQKNEESKR